MIFSIFVITLILIIWFKTDAFVVYCKSFGLGKLFNISEWRDFKNAKDISTTYHQFLLIKHPDGFVVKLITCPICLSVWLSLICSIFIGLLNLPIICIISLAMYYGIIKLM